MIRPLEALTDNVRTTSSETQASGLATSDSGLQTRLSGLPTPNSGLQTPLRLVRIIDRLNIGGPAKHVVWLTAWVDPGRFESTLIVGTVPDSEGDMFYFAREMGVRPLIVREMTRELGLRDIVVIWKLLGHLFRIKPDLIHTHKAKAGATGRLAAYIYRWATPSALWLRPRPCKLVHTFHGHIFDGYYGPARTRLFIWIERMLAWLCTDRIIVISPQQRRDICDRYRIGKPAQFTVIPLGLDLDEIEKHPGTLRRELEADERDILIGTVGRLCEIKNHALLLEAAAILLRARDPSLPCIRFVFVGDGELRPALEAQARRLGIESAITFLGFRKDAVAIYSDFDLVALTSTSEGTPLTLIEAMAAGRPVVATEVGGVVDILGERLEPNGEISLWEHGITTTGQSAASFAEALTYLIEHPDRRREMGCRGRLYVRTRLSRERLVRDIESQYDQLLQPAAALTELPVASIRT
jgi:glycosyltransferase involved in cell wall biosynthesis